MFFQMGFMRRFDAGYAAAKQQIEEGRIGTPLVFKSTSRDPFRPSLEYANPKSSGGMLLDMGIHDFDLARWFMGEVRTVSDDRRDDRLSGAGDGRRHRQRDREPDVRERQARRRRSEPQRHLRLRHLDRDSRLEGTLQDRLPARDAGDGDDEELGGARHRAVFHGAVPRRLHRRSCRTSRRTCSTSGRRRSRSTTASRRCASASPRRARTRPAGRSSCRHQGRIVRLDARKARGTGTVSSGVLPVSVMLLHSGLPRADRRAGPAIRAARTAQNQAIAAGDLDRVASFWTEDVTVRRALGQPLAGRDGGAAGARAAAAGAASGLSASDDGRRGEPDMAARLRDRRVGRTPARPRGPPVIGGRYSAQWVKRGGRWLIRSEVFVALTCSGVGCESAAVP